MNSAALLEYSVLKKKCEQREKKQKEEEEEEEGEKKGTKIWWGFILSKNVFSFLDS